MVNPTQVNSGKGIQRNPLGEDTPPAQRLRSQSHISDQMRADLVNQTPESAAAVRAVADAK